jgi:type IV secretion system protein VirB8
VATSKKDESKGEKKNWYNDRYQFVVVQRNVLSLITLLALVCSIAATFSISQLVPLKSVEPFVIQVDQKSGIAQVVDPLKAKELTSNDAINQYFMVEYIRAREAYLGAQDRNYYNYNLVRVLSDPTVFSHYQHDIILSNPDSPGSRLGSSGSREVHVSSLKFLDKKALPAGEESRRYLVRALVIERAGGALPKNMQKLILIEFKYTELELSIEDRYLNPIGFRVLSYRIDDDNIIQQ